MNRNINYSADSSSSPNLRGCANRTSLLEPKETIKKPLIVKELFNRDLNKSLLKLCSNADLRLKVLLSNTATNIKSSTSKFSSNVTTSELNTLTKSSTDDSSTTQSLSLDVSRHSTRKTPKHKNSTQKQNNIRIDKIDDPTDKQLSVLKILKLRELALKIEKRQISLIKSKFESSYFEKSYADGLEEGLRYGYLDNPNEEIKKQTDVTGKTNDSTDDNDKLQSENKDSKRLRGGFQEPQQKETRFRNKSFQDFSGTTRKKQLKVQAKSLNDLNQSNFTITNEYPNKCTDEVNFQDFKQKYEMKNQAGASKDFNGMERGKQYLQYFEEMLNTLSEDFSKGFKAGFGDGFAAANVFIQTNITFSDDEQKYISQMRKCLKFPNVNLNNDVKYIHARADELKKKLNISNGEFEDILSLIRKGLLRKFPLKFSKNDYVYYTHGIKQYKEHVKKKPSLEYDSDKIFPSGDDEKSFHLHFNKNRSLKYLRKHRINEFFQFLGSHLVATKPDDPISFLINLLDRCLEYRFNEYVTQAPLLFTQNHVESIYFVMDPLVTGYIDINQYIHGMEALGLTETDDYSINANFRPGEKIDKYIFVTNACRRLLYKFREMIAIDTISPHQSKFTYSYSNVEADSIKA